MKGFIDPYGLACQLPMVHTVYCPHRTIRTISWHAELSLAQFCNAEGLALPLTVGLAALPEFHRILTQSNHLAFGELHGHGRFAFPQPLLDDLDKRGQLEGFVTYYLGPDPSALRYQLATRRELQTEEDWEASRQQAEALRHWLAGEPPTDTAPIAIHEATL